MDCQSKLTPQAATPWCPSRAGSTLRLRQGSRLPDLGYERMGAEQRCAPNDQYGPITRGARPPQSALNDGYVHAPTMPGPSRSVIGFPHRDLSSHRGHRPPMSDGVAMNGGDAAGNCF
jgi:hypothetical protein